MSFYFQPPIFSVQPVVVAPQPVVHVTTTIPTCVVRPAILTVAAQTPPPPSPVVYVLPQVSSHDTAVSSNIVSCTDTNSHVPSRGSTLRIVFYGHNSATTTSESTSTANSALVLASAPRSATIWRCALDTSVKQRLTMASFRDEIPKMAARAGAKGSTWRTASIFVMYVHAKKDLDITGRDGAVRNDDVLRMLVIVNPSGASDEGGMPTGVSETDWNDEMERWERGQVDLYVVVRMDG
ncbi:hypothetical protein E4U21_007446 [Claviceps maximensis]|nr:hypothetical protein E4U21_007446 [Claviceps maximensis]